MKILRILCAVGLIIAGCNSNKDLSREEALNQIKQELNYPVVIDYDVYCSDPKSAKEST